MMQALAALWREEHLVDVCIHTPQDDGRVLAHKCVLAACSRYFHALFLGAGCCMRADQRQGGGGLEEAPQHSHHEVVRLPDFGSEDVRVLLAGCYDGHFQVHPANLERLLSLASFLEVPLALDACTSYMQQVLSDSTAVPLLILVSRYSLQALKAQIKSYICMNFSRFCMPAPQEDKAMATSQNHNVQLPQDGWPSTIASASMAAAAPYRRLSSSWQEPSSWPCGGSAGSSSSNTTLAELRYRQSIGWATGSLGSSQPLADIRSARDQGMRPAASQQHRGAWQDAAAQDIHSLGRRVSQPAAGGHLQSRSSRGQEEVLIDDVDGCEQAAAAAADAQPPSLAALPQDLLLELLCSEELAVDCELDIVSVLVDWVAADVPTRLLALPQLLEVVHLEDVPLPLPPSLSAASKHHAAAAAAVQELLERNNGTSSSMPAPRPLLDSPLGDSSSTCPPCRVTSDLSSMTMQHCAGVGVADVAQAASAAAACGGTPQQERASAHLPRQEQPSSARRRVRWQPSMLIAAGGRDTMWHSPKTVELYSPTANLWSPGPTMPYSVTFAAGALLRHELYIVGGTPLRTTVTKLVEGSHWLVCPTLLQPRAHAGLASNGSSLFAVGGRSQVQSTQHVLASMEVFTGDAWVHGPDMAVPRSALATAVLHSGLYAIGGQTHKSTLRSIERFDLGTEQWYSLSAQLESERKYGSAAVLGWRIYVVGGMDEARTRQVAVEALDPREGRWQQLAPVSMPRSSAGLAALKVGPHGRLFVAGGSAPGDQVHESVEMFIPEMGTWMPAAPLACGRSGLVLCAA